MNTSAFDRGRYRDAIRSGYYGIDEDLKKGKQVIYAYTFRRIRSRQVLMKTQQTTDPKFDNDNSGCTAVAALLTRNNVLYVSNAGDSRAVISTKDGRAIPLSQDHKPKHPKEEARIRNAGGFVENGRVNGSLALSRALGDFNFKANTNLTPDRQAVTGNHSN